MSDYLDQALAATLRSDNERAWRKREIERNRDLEETLGHLTGDLFRIREEREELREEVLRLTRERDARPDPEPHRLLRRSHDHHVSLVERLQAQLSLAMHWGRALAVRLPSNTVERHYPLADVEKLSGLSRRTLKRHIYDGKLRATKAGDVGHWLVSQTDLDAYLRRSSATP